MVGKNRKLGHAIHILKNALILNDWNICNDYYEIDFVKEYYLTIINVRTNGKNKEKQLKTRILVEYKLVRLWALIH